MVKQFLKIAGVKTQGEFYKKYPSEEAFFRAHPEAQNLVHQKMAYGGINAYEIGGEPTSNDYLTYALFKQAHDAWEASQNTPQVDEDAYMAAASQGNIPAAALTQQSGYQAYPPIYMPSVNQQTSAPMTPSPNSGRYSGGSIVDYLKSQGLPYDYASRKKMADIHKITDYKKTNNAAQNLKLLRSLRNASGNAPEMTDADYAAFAQSQADQNPFIMEGSRNPDVAPTSGFAGFGQYPGMGTNPGIPSVSVVGAPTKKSSSGVSGATIAAEVALGTGVAAGAFSEIKDLIKRASKGEYLSGQAKAKVTAYRNQFRNQMLKEAGKNIKAQIKWFDKLPKEQQNILKNLDAMEISGDMHLMPKGTASRDLYTRDMLNEANAENMLTSTNDALREVEEEAKALRSANAKKAAAARWGSKAIEAEKALGLGDRFIGGLKAIGRAKYVAPIVEAGKAFFEAIHRDGGESGTYSNGVYYQAGGSYNPTTVDYGNTLPQFAMGYNVPTAMYGGGMAYGGDLHEYQQDGQVREKGYGCKGKSCTKTGEGIRKIGVRFGANDEGVGGNTSPMPPSNARITWDELQNYNSGDLEGRELKDYNKGMKARTKQLQSQFPGLTEDQLRTAGADSARIGRVMFNPLTNESDVPNWDKQKTPYDRAWFDFYRPMMNQPNRVTVPQIIQFQSQQPGGLPAYKQTVEGNYGRTKAAKGGPVYEYGYAMGGTPCYNCGGMYDQGGMYPDGRAIVNRGPYEGRALVNAYAQGGLVKGSVHDISEQDVQHLINQGYKIQYL
jgi:hypothetical protein